MDQAERAAEQERAGRRSWADAPGGARGLSRRRLWLALLLWAPGLRAQPAPRPYRLGVLWHAESREGEGPMFTALMAGLQERGLVDGQNLRIEHRFAAEKPERFQSLAVELVALKPDVLLGVSPQSVLALKASGTDLPVVFAAIGDPVALGLVQTWGRPGSNFTGFTVIGPELIPKQLQLLVELLPRTRRIGFLHNPDAPTFPRWLRELTAASEAMGIAVALFAARDAAEIQTAFAKMTDARIQAILTAADALMYRERALNAREAVARGIAEVTTYRESLLAGSLMTYGPSLPDSARRSAEYIARILKGASPRELPVVGPTRFELLVNLRTARALGVTIPSAIALRADEMIE